MLGMNLLGILSGNYTRSLASPKIYILVIPLYAQREEHHFPLPFPSTILYTGTVMSAGVSETDVSPVSTETRHSWQYIEIWDVPVRLSRVKIDEANNSLIERTRRL